MTANNLVRVLESNWYTLVGHLIEILRADDVRERMKMVMDADIGVKMRGIRATVLNKIASYEEGEDYPDLPIPDQEVDRVIAREKWGRRRSGGERIWVVSDMSKGILEKFGT